MANYLITYRAKTELTGKQYAQSESEAIEMFKTYFKPEDGLEILRVDELKPVKL